MEENAVTTQFEECHACLGGEDGDLEYDDDFEDDEMRRTRRTTTT